MIGILFRRDEEYAFIPAILCLLTAVSKLFPRKVPQKNYNAFLAIVDKYTGVRKVSLLYSFLPFRRLTE
jgi:hypothetical protein